MKLISTFSLKTFLVGIVFFVGINCFSQISSPTANSVIPTVYTNGAPNNSIYMFCVPNQSTADIGRLTATSPAGTAPFTFNWSLFNSGTYSFDPYATTVGATSTITNLPSGGYFVSIVDAGGVGRGCFIAWVFNNRSFIDVANITAGCAAFQLNGTASPVANFVYYNPPVVDQMIINATTTITVCFNATHTWVSDLGFYLVSPCGQTITLSPNPGSIGQGTVCNSGDNVNNLCFSTSTTNQLDVCAGGAFTLTGTFGEYGPGAGTAINWPSLYGCDAAQAGWKVQIYDCIGGDVGALTAATVTFSGNTPCGAKTISYNSGAINSAINDNSCTAASASNFVVPPVSPSPISLTTPNTITSFQWTSNNPCVVIPNATTSLTPTISPVPTSNTWFYLSATDNMGCINLKDSALFVSTCPCPITALSKNILPCNSAPNTFDITGQVTFSNPPCSGQLIVTTCSGAQQVFNAPFVSPINYTLTGITSDGTAGCTVTANFTNGPAGCIFSTPTFTEPTPVIVVITNPAAVCAPATIDLTAAAVTAGSTIGGTLTYWTNIGATISLASPNAVAASGTYYIQNTLGICKDIQPVTVTINATPVLTITSPAAVCAPGTANITAPAVTAGSTGGGTLTYWTDAAATIALASPNAVTTSGTYYIQSTIGTCKDIEPVIVTISPAPSLTITNPAAICAPNTIDITAAAVTAGSTGGGTLTYWTDAGATISLASSNAVSISGTYYIQSSVGTCQDIKPVTVTVNPTPVLMITNPPAVCSPNTVDITVAAVTAGSTGGGLLTYFTDAGATTALASPNVVNGSGIYYIKATTGAGCSDIQAVTVIINPKPVLVITDPAAVCAPNTVDITTPAITAGSTGGGTLSYWTDAAATISLASPNALAISGTYYIKTTTASACIDVQPITIIVNPKPLLVITNPAPVCAPNTIDITVAAVTAGSTGGGILTYWTDAIATTALASPNAIAASGIYYIETTTAAGCADIKPVTVTINPTPILVITDPAAVCAPGTIDITTPAITAGSTGGGTLTYWTDAAATASLASPNAVAISGTYYIKTTTASGCFDIELIVVTISPAPILIITNPAAVCAPNTIDITAAAVTAGSTGGGTLTYWTDPSATNALTSPNAVSNSATYYIMSTVGSCQDIKPVTIIINPTPVLSITDPTGVCFPNTINITVAAITAGSTGGGVLTYWTDAAATSTLTSPNAVAVSGIYYIMSTTVAGCFDVAPVTVTINPLPVLSITNPADVCSPGSADITAAAVTAGSTGSGILTYWQDAGATIALSSPNAIGISGTYYIQTTTGTGCIDVKPVTVTINPKPTLVITNPAAVCAPNSVDIASPGITAGSTAGGTLTYWTDAAATAALASPNVVAASGTYYIQTTTLAGCSDIEPVVVTINPLPVLVITNPNPVCQPNTIDITAAGVTAGSTIGVTFSYWTDAGATIALSSPNAIAISGVYYIKGTTGSSCIDIEAVTIVIHPKPTPNFIPDALVGCEPLCIKFANTSFVASGTIDNWRWSFSDGGSSADTNATNCFNNAGTYDVTLTVTTNNGCSSTLNNLNMITVNPLPDANFTAPLSTSILIPTIQYSDQSTVITPGTIISWHWNFGDLLAGTDSVSSLQNPSHTFSEVGTYCAELIVTSDKSCKDTTEYCIVIDPEFTFFIPNAFSPNDDGINDEFFGKGDFINKFEMLIYDRWGNLTFSTDDINKHWNGKTTTGAETSQEDIYVYVVKISDNQDKKHTYIGSVTIVK